MFEAVELPARIADLDSSLTNMKADDFPHPEMDLSRKGGRAMEREREDRERERETQGSLQREN